MSTLVTILIIVLIVLLLIAWIDSNQQPQQFQPVPPITEQFEDITIQPYGPNKVYQANASIYPADYYMLQDGVAGKMRVENNICSKSCCSPQWPTPFKQEYNPSICQNRNNYVPSGMTCNNLYNDAGCLCLTKDQSLSLQNRGGNVSE